MLEINNYNREELGSFFFSLPFVVVDFKYIIIILLNSLVHQSSVAKFKLGISIPSVSRP